MLVSMYKVRDFTAENRSENVRSDENKHFMWQNVKKKNFVRV
jgi:hypothetical protein